MLEIKEWNDLFDNESISSIKEYTCMYLIDLLQMNTVGANDQLYKVFDQI